MAYIQERSTADGKKHYREMILTADLDLNDIGMGKFDFDVVGPTAGLISLA